MILTLAVALLAICAVVPWAARRVSIGRHRAAARAALEPVVVAGEKVDSAELIWSVRQATHEPTLRMIGSPAFGSAERVVDVVSAAVDKLSPDQRLDLIVTRTRLQQTREARETLTCTADSLAATAAPAVTDALVIAIAGAIGASVLEGATKVVTSTALETLVPHTTAGGLAVDHVPGADHALDVVASAVGDGVGNAVGAVVDAHIPVVTIVMSIHRANRSRERGLDQGRVAENLAWDLGAKGGAIMGGAAIGTAIFPVVGTAIGALLGAALGSGAAHLGKHRHLAEAQRQLLASVEELGSTITRDDLRQILAESERMLALKRGRHRQVLSESAQLAASWSWRQRVFQPTVGGKIAELVVKVGAADIAYDESLHSALRASIAGSTRSQQAKVYLWTAGRHLMGWHTFDGPDTSGLQGDIELVLDEQEKLVLAR